MAISLRSSGTAAASTDSVTIASATDRLLVVCVHIEDGTETIDADAVDIAGTDLSSASLVSQGDNKIRWFYLLDADFPATGSQTITATFSGTPADVQLSWLLFDEAPQDGAPVGASATGASVSSQDVDITTGEDNALVVTATGIGNLNDITTTYGDASLARVDDSSSRSRAAYELDAGTAGAESITWSYGGTANRAVSQSLSFEEAPTVDDSLQSHSDVDMRGNDLKWNDAHGQKIDLWSNEAHGIGTQNNTTYVRTSGGFSVHQSGGHDDTEDDPGSGGTSIFHLTQAPEKMYHVGKRVWTAGNTVGATVSAAISPVAGQMFFETTNNRMCVYDGSEWHYLGGGSVTSVAHEVGTMVDGDTDEMSSGNTWTPTIVQPVHYHVFWHADIDAAGRAGYMNLEYEDGNDGTWTEIRDVRWHDASEGENVRGSFSGVHYPTVGEVASYRLKYTVDGGSGSASVRGGGESGFFLDILGGDS